MPSLINNLFSYNKFCKLPQKLRTFIRIFAASVLFYNLGANLFRAGIKAISAIKAPL
jgi:hypothetical protein